MVASTASLWTSPARCEIRMLESRLVLKVTVLAPEPHDHVANGHTVKDRVGVVQRP